MVHHREKSESLVHTSDTAHALVEFLRSEDKLSTMKASLLKFAVSWQNAENGKVVCIEVPARQRLLVTLLKSGCNSTALKGRAMFVFFYVLCFASNRLKSRGFKEQPRDFQL